jgi:hypothetical protein
MIALRVLQALVLLNLLVLAGDVLYNVLEGLLALLR